MSDHTPSTEPTVVQHSHEFWISNGSDARIAQCAIMQQHGVYWLVNVYVDGKHRRQGLARKVIGAALQTYAGRGIPIYLNVTPYGNRPMDADQLARFYSSFGFEPATDPGVMVYRAGKHQRKRPDPGLMS